MVLKIAPVVLAVTKTAVPLILWMRLTLALVRGENSTGLEVGVEWEM